MLPRCQVGAEIKEKIIFFIFIQLYAIIHGTKRSVSNRHCGKEVKTMKKTLSLLLCIIMALSVSSVAFAATTYSGAISGDVTISKGDDVKSDAVFKGKVTIDSGFTLTAGTFNGPVTNNGTISKNLLSSTTPVFTGKVTNNGTITNGSFSNAVENKNKISGGTFHCYIYNNGGTASGVTAVVYSEADGKKWTVQGNPTITTTVAPGSGSTFTCPKGYTLHVSGSNAELCLNGNNIIKGTIIVDDGGKIKSDSGSLDSSSDGVIRVMAGSSFGGLKKSAFSSITKTQHSITCPQNTDDVTMLYVQDTAFSGDTVNFNINLNAQIFKDCYAVTGIEVKDSKGNLVTKTTDKNSNFNMPDSDVKITVSYTESHNRVTKAPTCDEDGYDYCTKCFKVFDGSTVSKLGHQGTWNVTTYPTESSYGYKTMHCTRCNRDVQEVIPKKYGVKMMGSAKTVDYRTTLVFHADWSDVPDAKLVWIVNGDEHDDDGSKTYKVEQAKSDQTVSVKVVDSKNNKTYNSDTGVKVTVNNKFFWDKIIAFFKYLFKEPPTEHIK